MFLINSKCRDKMNKSSALPHLVGPLALKFLLEQECRGELFCMRDVQKSLQIIICTEFTTMSDAQCQLESIKYNAFLCEEAVPVPFL